MEPGIPTCGFSAEQSVAVYWRDAGICTNCKKKCEEGEYEIDHIIPHSKGGNEAF